MDIFGMNQTRMDDSAASSSNNEDIDISSDSVNEEFFFESDHLALRGNADYRAVLRALVVLEAQKIEAGKHIDLIATAKKDALDDPSTLAKNLASGEVLNLPGPINIENLPQINFTKYNVDISLDDDETEKKSENNDLTVRGRVFDQTKPETFNQLWTCEEQRRLEELLIEYPPEPVERRRFAKIARALGNRTTKQVASRLQKYFQKLHAAGLPVPGRIPRGPRTYQSVRKSRMHKHMYRPTTFFPSNYVPVNIVDDDEASVNFLDPNTYRKSQLSRRDSSASNSRYRADAETIVVDEPSDTEVTAETDKEKIVRLLKRVKRDKEKNYGDEKPISEHMGYECDLCRESPIVGTRWHCTSCTTGSADFCADCMVTQTISKHHHPLDHKFIGLRLVTRECRSHSDDNDENAEDEQDDRSFGLDGFDQDYMTDKFARTNNSYNYMDPNFMLD